MCGILGLFRVAPDAPPITDDLLTTLRDTMAHRGPNDHGNYLSPDGVIGLAHRRLSIIDLSKGATQPMSNADGTVWLIFNGEIYNHAEVRKELEALGRRFKTDHSDTEVILIGYEQWGHEVLHRLRGMFAFAIWDAGKGDVWLARDRMGVKPLYYAQFNGIFLFASEIKAILAYPGFPRKVNEKAFYDYLTFIATPPPNTLFQGVSKLEAAHTLTVHSDGRMESHRYWNPFSDFPKAAELDEAALPAQTLEKFRESVRYRMVSDVNMGVFLSGGIDSSAICAVMTERSAGPVDTYSVGFEGPIHFTELPFARLVVDRYRTRHHELIMTPEQFVGFLPKLVYYEEEPIGDPVSVPIYFLSKLARENGTTVCQVGEGADELFCGYPHWAKSIGASRWAARYQVIPGFLRRLAARVVTSLPFLPWKAVRRADVFRRVSFDEPAFWGGAEAFQELGKKKFLSRAFLKRLDGYSSLSVVERLRKDFVSDSKGKGDELQWMGYIDLRLRLPEILLMRVDKMTMATGVEGRVPFLDQELVKFAMRLPEDVRFKGDVLKSVLKKAVEPVLPNEVIYRKKQGFSVPVNDWFREKLGTWAEAKILEFAARTDYFDPSALAGMIKNSGRNVTWFLLNFVLWHELWIEGKEIDVPL